MAERSAVDPAVDELRRKARRRLVGAVVLALAAAVILPMLLEKEQRPLGEDVSVKIPPVDEGKFVNRLSGGADSASRKAGDDAAPAASAAPPGPTSAGSSAAGTITANRSAAPTGAAPAAAASSPTPMAEPPASASGPPATTANPPSEPRPAAPVEASSDGKAAATSATPPKPGGTQGYVVQLAAFSDDKGANALTSKLKRSGYAAYTESVQTSRGTLYRVRVGGYGTREAASDARSRLKSAGYNGIVAPAH